MNKIATVDYRTGSIYVVSDLLSERIEQLTDALFRAAQWYTNEQLLHGQAILVLYMTESESQEKVALDLGKNVILVTIDDELATLVGSGMAITKALQTICRKRVIEINAEQIVQDSR